MNTHATVALVVLSLAPACGSGEAFEQESPSVCPAASGPAHGMTADGRVDVTAVEAWPNRPAEPAALTRAEIAAACAVLVACNPQIAAGLDAGGPQPDGGASGADQALAVALCTDGANMWEERAVPSPKSNERWSFEARAMIAAHGDCAAIAAIETARPDAIVCEEDGCYWNGAGAPSVSCNGDVATLVTGGSVFTRDCSRAYLRCDASSRTGCAERPQIACDPSGLDRCDGNVKLGCDHCGVVSFHDCSLFPAGQCAEQTGGARCAYANAGACTPADQRCDGSTLLVCVAGELVATDCQALGLGGCVDRHCSAL